MVNELSDLEQNTGTLMKQFLTFIKRNYTGIDNGRKEFYVSLFSQID